MAVAVAERLYEQLGPLRLPQQYCPVEPHAKQEWFLRRDELECFFGGSAGPGKSWALLMAALQYVDVPGYHALLLRPALTEFEQPGGLIEVSHDWLDMSDAYWHGGHRSWTFPSGASIRFGYLAHQGDLRQYKGPSYSFAGFDELTGFDERLYKAMFRVLRQAKGVLDDVPLRMRGASNPGDVGHAWVKRRFISKDTRLKGAVFVPASIHDNPHLDYEEYLKSLQHLDPIDRMRLINGDWDVTEEGGKFDRHKIMVVTADEVLPAQKAVRYWDLAGSKPTPSYPDPDYTVGLKLQVDKNGTFTVADVIRGRWEDSEVQEVVRATASQDGTAIPVYVEQDPGQAGKAQLSHYKRHVLRGYQCTSGSTKIAGKSAAKEVRARPVAAAVGNGLVQVIGNEHVHDFLDELSIFPNGVHDDIVDALSGAHTALTQTGSSPARVSSAVKARISTDSRDRRTATVR